MKKFPIPYSLFFILAVFLLLPAVASAHAEFPYWGSIVTCSKNFPSVENPGGGCALGDLPDTLVHAIYFGMTLALFFAAPALFAWGGILILISGGNPSRLEQGKKVLTGTLIGVAIILLAYLAVQAIVQIIGITGIGGFSK